MPHSSSRNRAPHVTARLAQFQAAIANFQQRVNAEPRASSAARYSPLAPGLSGPGETTYPRVARPLSVARSAIRAMNVPEALADLRRQYDTARKTIKAHRRATKTPVLE